MKKLYSILIAAVALLMTAGMVFAAQDFKSNIKFEGGGTYDYVIVSEMAKATDGFDNAYDSIFGGDGLNATYIKTVIRHDDWDRFKQFRRDTRALAPTQEWVVTFTTNVPNGTAMTVSQFLDSNVPKGYSLTLQDMASGTITDILKNKYAFTVADNSAPMQFKVTAKAPAMYSLTAKKTGNGSITPDSGSLSWAGNTGTGSYQASTPVVLTAMADPGSIFGSWTGCASVSGSKCNVTMSSDKTVSATFTTCAYSLGMTSKACSNKDNRFTVKLNATGVCGWTAVSNVSWIKVTSAASGTGTTNVSLAVELNKTKAARTGTVTIGGKTFTVNQAK